MTDSNLNPANFNRNFIAHGVTDKKSQVISNTPMIFHTSFTGSMEMYGDEETVSKYLSNHQGWFIRCAEPMKVRAFGENGYTLSVGKYGAFGYNLEPQMSVILETPESNRYSMYSVANPQFDKTSNYEVNYRSNLQIESIPVSQASQGIEKVYRQKGLNNLPHQITKIHWTLNLTVKIQFPNFIYRLPTSMIQSTGNRLLAQIVKQISPRLSYKVQKDFHSRCDLPIPGTKSRSCHPIDVKLN